MGQSFQSPSSRALPRWIAMVAMPAVLGCLCPRLLDALADETSPQDAARQIDALLANEVFSDPAGGTPDLAPMTGDQAFLRRVTLDLVGHLPSPSEVTAFALDRSPGKRAQVVERLLGREEFGRNWGRYWRDVIFYRRSDERALLAAPTVEGYLAESFNSGVPWDELARSFIEATGDIRQQGGTGIIAAQMGDTAEVTSEVSRIFLGVQIQCAQCHDHPTDRWKRNQFHELAAFFPRIALRPVRNGMQRSFEVVSRDFVGRPRRPGGMGRRGEQEHYMPDLNDPSAQGTLMTPTFFLTGESLPLGQTDLDRRGTLADWITAETNPWFAQALVNRLWSEMVGEGFYEPVDDMGPDRTCSAPQTLEFLAGQFAAHGYDLKWLFAAIAATEAYQRESRPRRNPGETPFTANCAQRLRSDQVFDVLMTALGVDTERGQQNRPMGGPYGRGGPRREFTENFGYDPSDPRAEVTGAIPQALLLMNSRAINGALNGRNPRSALGKLLADTEDNDEVAVELYLRCLAREPNDKELAACLDHVGSAGDRVAAFEDVFWALINSTEFLHRN